MKHRSPSVALSIAILAGAGVFALVNAQTAIQRPRTVSPAITNAAKFAQSKPASSAMHVNPPDPIPLEPDWQGKHEPLTLHVADTPAAGRGLLISVTRANGAGYFDVRQTGVVQVYSPYYQLKRVDRTLDIATFVFGNDTVESKVVVSPNGNFFTLTLACQRTDPDIPANATTDARPFLVTVSRKNPETGVVERGEAIVTLNGYVVEKP